MRNYDKTKALHFISDCENLEVLSPKSMEIFAYLLMQPYSIQDGDIVSDSTYDEISERYGVSKAAISSQLSKLKDVGLLKIKKVRRGNAKIVLGEIDGSKKLTFYFLNFINRPNKISNYSSNSSLGNLKSKLLGLFKEKSTGFFRWDKNSEKLIKEILEYENHDGEKIIKYYNHFLDYGDYCAKFKYTNKSPKTFCIFYESMPYLYESSKDIIPAIHWVLEADKLLNKLDLFKDFLSVEELARKVHYMTNYSDETLLNDLTNKFKWFLENYKQTSAKYNVPSIELFLKTLNEICGLFSMQQEQGDINIELTELFN
jgi:DNA-binding transcriptional ArsR family regulator